MARNILTMTLLILALSGISVKAQEHSKYSLQQCLDFAVRNSYAAHRASLDIREAEHQMHEARSGVLPQINASGSFDNSIVIPTMMLPGEIIEQPGTQIPVQMGTTNTLDFSVTAEQIIFAPSLFTGIKIAKNNRELQKLRAAMTKEEIIFNVSYAFYDILNSMQELDNINYMIVKQDSLSLLMKKRVEENITREVDLNRVKVNLTNLRARGENIKSAISQQKRYLQILIGMPIGDSLELDDSGAKNSAISVLQTDSPSQNKVELDILNKQKDILGLDIQLSKMGYLPTLSAIASAGYQFQSDKLNLTKEPWFSSAIVGVRLSIPLFDGLSKRSQIKQKRIQLQRLDWDIVEARQNIFMNHQNAKDRLQVVFGLVQAQSENLQLAEKVYAQTMALYSEGLSSITDLLETETSLREAKIAYTTELIRYRKTEIDLLKANGTLENLLENN
jgi:Outer membrane protein